MISQSEWFLPVRTCAIFDMFNLLVICLKIFKNKNVFKIILFLRVILDFHDSIRHLISKMTGETKINQPIL